MRPEVLKKDSSCVVVWSDMSVWGLQYGSANTSVLKISSKGMLEFEGAIRSDSAAFSLMGWEDIQSCISPAQDIIYVYLTGRSETNTIVQMLVALDSENLKQIWSKEFQFENGVYFLQCVNDGVFVQANGTLNYLSSSGKGHWSFGRNTEQKFSRVSQLSKDTVVVFSRWRHAIFEDYHSNLTLLSILDGSSKSELSFKTVSAPQLYVDDSQHLYVVDSYQSATHAASFSLKNLTLTPVLKTTWYSQVDQLDFSCGKSPRGIGASCSNILTMIDLNSTLQTSLFDLKHYQCEMGDIIADGFVSLTCLKDGIALVVPFDAFSATIKKQHHL
jgi:hypothetical protein